jgi:2-amino-4-hydroxy-6-hydroxymethyldihydropteridine diphosphokinase
MKIYTVFLGLGSNLGERQKYLNDAAKALGKIIRTKVIWTSSVYETDPIGKPDQPKFFNAAVEIETELSPRVLFEEVKAIEQRLGRTSTEKWGAREIDIDILVYDGLVFEDERIKVPHPELENRRFVLIPLREIAPDLVHPVNGMTVSELTSSCQDAGRVVKTLHHIVL